MGIQIETPQSINMTGSNNNNSETTVRSWLEDHNLGEYYEMFHKERVGDVNSMASMSDDDLKKMGMPLDARQKFLSAAGTVSGKGTEPDNMLTGMAQGTSKMAGGVGGGAKDMVQKPYHEAHDKEGKGFMQGMKDGLKSAADKISSGFSQGAEKISQGTSNTMDKHKKQDNVTSGHGDDTKMANAKDH